MTRVGVRDDDDVGWGTSLSAAADVARTDSNSDHQETSTMASGPAEDPSPFKYDPSRPDIGDQRFDLFPAHSRRGDRHHLHHLRTGLRLVLMPPGRQEPLRVFRYSRLPEGANSDELSPTIRQAMDNAAWFLLLASVWSAGSRWVGEEIRYWLSTRGTDQIIIVVTEGDCAWNVAAGDFDPRRSSAIHPALRGVLSRKPPLLDMRWAAAGPGPVPVDRRLTDLVTSIASLVLNCPKEQVRVAEPTGAL